MITFDSMHETYVTFHADSALQAGSVCCIKADSTVGPCTDGGTFCGLVRQIRCGLAGVVLSGYVELPYTGTAPALGETALQANASGGVKAGGSKTYLVVHVDTNDKTVGFFL